jgi:WhiB family transcriptional regulator, redox-sensing transcriptional regulator
MWLTKFVLRGHRRGVVTAHTLCSVQHSYSRSLADRRAADERRVTQPTRELPQSASAPTSLAALPVAPEPRSLALLPLCGPKRLPPPRIEEWDWQSEGKCRDVPVNVFFPEGMRGYQLRKHEDRAKGICRECPVLKRCRQHAIDAPEPHGVWGATTPRERAILLSRPRRGAAAE